MDGASWRRRMWTEMGSARFWIAEVLPDLRVRRVIRVRRDLREMPARRLPKATPVRRAPRATPVRRASRVTKARRALPGCIAGI